MEPASKKVKMAKSPIKCGVCGKSFSHKESLMRHRRSVHTGMKWHCATCDMVFSRKDNFQRHKRNHDKQPVQNGGGVTTTSTETNEKTDPCNFKALNGTVETHTIDANGLNKFDPMSFLKSQYDDVKDVIKRKIKERGGLKWYLSMKVKMSRRKVDNIELQSHISGGNARPV
ncbi:KRAB [Mytilus edulis]|uniref:KRAB n=1 Tax=Mytilus edulis TaxID=6550 RepID=A0A8S3S0B7_MYTED|nr:KRAB [Mytilus edulis]